MKKLIGAFKGQEAAIAGIIAVMSVIFTIRNPIFFSVENLMDVLKANSVLGIMACGMFLVIISGGIDVSVGAIISASACVAGTVLVRCSSNVFLAFLIAGATGAVLGGLNGLLISRLRIPPLVVTLGTYSIIMGIMVYLTNGSWITGIPDSLMRFGGLRPLGIPIQAYFFAGTVALTWFLVKFTLWGRGVFAIGGDELSASRIGFNTTVVQHLIYVYIGFLAGISSMVHTSIMQQIDPNAFKGYEMQVISAVVLGGTNIAGGYGTIGGVVLGVVFLAVTNNGMVLMKVPVYWQQIIIGCIMLFAIFFNIVRKKKAEAKNVRIDVE